MYIYIDILIITNIYADFLLLKSAAVLTHAPLKTLRGLAAAFLGGLSSLIILLPKLNLFLLVGIKLLTAALLVYTAFGCADMRIYLRRLFVFFLISFVYAGIGTVVSELLGGKFIASANGIVYVDFSMGALVITTIAAYLCVCVYRMLSDGGSNDEVYTLIISDRGKCVSISAVADTGNVLRDSFTGKPVIVCPGEKLAAVYGNIPCDISDDSFSSSLYGWRFIPYSTASGGGIIPIIHPEEVCLRSEQNGIIAMPDVYIGAGSSGMECAVFNPKIFA